MQDVRGIFLQREHSVDIVELCPVWQDAEAVVEVECSRDEMQEEKISVDVSVITNKHISG
jgi:hypothetical protein